MSFSLTLEEAARLHGHKGPWLVLGYRAGFRAKEVFKPRSEHDLHCIVETPLKTPYTCAIDGIQASSGCTMGKLNLEVKEAEVKEITYTFIEKRTGVKLKLKLKPEIVERIEEIFTNLGLKEAAEFIEEEELRNLFIEEYVDE